MLFAPGAPEPARVIALDSETLRVDLNHPSARFPVQVQCKLNRVLPGSDRRGGRCVSPLDELVVYAGLAAPLPDGSPSDFGDSANGLLRFGRAGDPVFYTSPRLVQQLADRLPVVVTYIVYLTSAGSISSPSATRPP